MIGFHAWKILCLDPGDAEGVLPGHLPVRDPLHGLADNHLDEFIMHMIIYILQLITLCHMLKYHCPKQCEAAIGIWDMCLHISSLPTMFSCRTHVRQPCQMVVYYYPLSKPNYY